MKRIILPFLGLLLTTKALAFADDQTDLESKKLLSAYETLVDRHEDTATLAETESVCKLDACAINFKAGEQSLGFYANLLSGVGTLEEGSPIMAFAVLPEGATLEASIPTITLPERGRKLSLPKLLTIGARTQKALGILGWVGFEELVPWISECRAISEAVTCRLNFRSEREPFGVLLKGYLNTEDELIFVSAFSTEPNGV